MISSRRRKSQRGGSLIEFTFVGIPLMFVLISIFEASRGMWTYNLLAHAIKEGRLTSRSNNFVQPQTKHCPWSVRGRGRSRRAKTDELHPMLPFCPPLTPRQRTRTDSEAVRRPRNRPFGQQPGAHVLSAALAAVRTYQSRPGVSLNLEQQVTETVGFFARAGLADGNVEP